MAWTTTPYATLADVKTLLDRQTSADDAFLTTLLAQAQSFLDRQIGYSFQTDGTVPSPATRTYSGSNTDTLLIEDTVSLVQVIEVQQVAVLGANGVWQLSTVSTQDITADVILGPLNTSPGFLLSRISDNPFYLGKLNYTVKGVFGQPGIPAEIARATARLAGHWYQMRDTNYTDTIADQGVVRMRFNKQIPPDVAEVIAAYKKRLFLTGW